MRTWNPFQEMEQLRREINGIFGNFEPARRVAFLPGVSARSYPRVNVYEDQDHYFIEALAPGINPDSLDVSIVGNVVTLAGEKTRVTEDVKSDAYHRSERAAGRFVRTVEMPSEVKTGDLTAEYKNGLVLITLPKAEETKPKKIAVKVA